MDRLRSSHDDFWRPATNERLSVSAILTYAIFLLWGLHALLTYLEYPILSPRDLIWNGLVHLIPEQLLLDRAQRRDLKTNEMLSQTHAAKSEALRRLFATSSNSVLQTLPIEGVVRRTSTSVFSRPQLQHRGAMHDIPPGLGNGDNSCYQNSILQGLASLDSLKPYLQQAESGCKGGTSAALLETVHKLNDVTNNGKHIWTPAKLKSMSSWQQQDAQEYFSKIIDTIEKEATKSHSATVTRRGVEAALEHELDSDTSLPHIPSNPMEGLVAQRVVCTRCGFSEGVSLIPFNCLTVPLGSKRSYSLSDCLDEYTRLDEITDVECGKCTLLRAEQQLKKMLPADPSPSAPDADAPSGIDNKLIQLPPELRRQAFQKLADIQSALDRDDFEDQTLSQTCQISKKARVLSTKTRQTVVGRAPQNLVVHVNRSVFDEITFMQRKNHADVRFPRILDLTRWILPTDREGGHATEGEAMWKYRIKAIVTHFGRHENGHYVCYREHPVRPEPPALGSADGSEAEAAPPSHDGPAARWWRLSDEDVSAVSEAEMLAPGGVFMLFYERLPRPTPRAPRTAATPVPDTEQQRASPALDRDLVDATAVLLPADADAAPSTDLQSLPAAHVTPDAAPGPRATPLSTTTEEHAEAATAAAAAADDDGGASAKPPDATLATPATPNSARKSPPLTMRTARGRRRSSRSESGFGGVLRPVAAT